MALHGALAQSEQRGSFPAGQASEAAAMLAEPGPIAAVIETADLPSESLPAALARADQLRGDLGHEATRAEALKR